MANEVNLAAFLAYTDSEGSSVALSVPAALLATVATKRYHLNKQSVTITEVAINLGSVTSLGWSLFINRDTTNFVELRVATAGIKFAKLLAGKFAFFYFGSGISAPFAIADTASCQLEYLIISA